MAIRGDASNIRRRDDHDLLIEIRGQVNQTVLDVASVRNDIKEMKENTTKRVEVLEEEITKIKDRQTYWLGGLAVINVILGIVVAFGLKLLP